MNVKVTAVRFKSADCYPIPLSRGADRVEESNRVQWWMLVVMASFN